ncbi:MAG: adenosylcobalamin-dependent ribonucleoside-diphosphate reductase [Spirochaetales bacterium]|nr:adenosylcobalamin-dependent ribonucleoside-diphosphate reductase [Spirochaetales bacterium]
MIKWEQPLSEEIFRTKYMLNGEKAPEDVFRGVAREIASVEKDRAHWEERFHEEIVSGRLIPAGRILANARPESPMKNYNNCFTIDIEDSMEKIYDSLKEDAVISKMGGGVGFDVSKLRPKDELLSKGGASSGPLSFLNIFDQSAKTIMTGGYRRSAHIALMDISHPDVEEFITAKQGDQNKQLTQFNISVKVSDAFMKAVEADADWDLVHDGKVYRTVKARDLYDKLAKNSYIHNEPGIFYGDRVEQYNNGYWAFKMDRVNPCGELVMPSYSLCCLSSINLGAFVVNPFTEEAYFDFDAFRETVAVGIRFLDNVLDVTAYPLKKIEDFSRQWRRIGLGFTALGDTLAMLQLPYGSEDSIIKAGEIAKALRDASYLASCDLAEEKGAFSAFDGEKILEAEFIKTLPQEIRERIGKVGLRNIQMNTVAPTGTISLSVGQNCSSGIEPIFALQYDRNIRTGNGDETRKETVYDRAWLLYKEQNPQATQETKPDYFSTTVEIDPYRSIDLQAAVQKYVDHSISKTLNLPMGTDFEEYKNLFSYAFNRGLKGFTTFNPEGSMKGILEYREEKKKTRINRELAPERPAELTAHVNRIKADGRSRLIVTGILKGSLYELFCIDEPEEQFPVADKAEGKVIKVQSGRYDLHVEGEKPFVLEDFTNAYDSTDSSLARFISMSLRHGTPLQFIVNQLTRDKNFIGFERTVSRVIKGYIQDGEEVVAGEKECPDCSSGLVFRDGCVTCPDCGWSKCS